MKERDFNKACQQRGYLRVAPKLYARCYGDGIYQTIYTGFRAYLDPFCKSYSPAHKKANYIDIGVRSMYSRTRKENFTEWLSGGYSPDSIHGGSNRSIFVSNDIEEEYDKMCEFGFDALDKIASQRDFLNLSERVMTGRQGTRIHSLHLAIPYLMIGDFQNASFEITRHYTDCMFGFHLTHDYLLDNGEYAAYIEAIRNNNSEMEYVTRLWKAVLGEKETDIQKIIQENYTFNLSCLQKCGVPMVKTDQFGKVERIFKTNTI